MFLGRNGPIFIHSCYTTRVKRSLNVRKPLLLLLLYLREEVSESEEAPVIASNEVAVHNSDVIKTVTKFLL